jgi:hypothetical protein
MSAARITRMVEIYVYAALLGVLLAVVLVRMLLLFLEMPTQVLVAVLLAGGAGGMWVGHSQQRKDAKLIAILQSKAPLFRALCLKTVLGLLAIAAVVGVLTVLTASYDVLGRLSGTLAATAVAAAILWPLSALLDNPKSMAAGLLGIIATTVVYCMAIPLIWGLGFRQQEILYSSLAIGFSSPFGMAALRLIELPKTQLAGRVGTLLYAIALASFLTAAWSTDNWRESGHWWMFGLYVSSFGALVVACLTGMRTPKWRHWRWLGVAASLAGWTLFVMQEWALLLPDKAWVILSTSTGCGFAFASICQLFPLAFEQRWLRVLTIFAAAVTVLFLNLETLLAPDFGIGILGRISGAASVVASCSTLALVVFAGLNRRRAIASPTQEINCVVLYCPGCGKKQTLAMGGDDCEQCGLRLSIVIS